MLLCKPWKQTCKIDRLGVFWRHRADLVDQPRLLEEVEDIDGCCLAYLVGSERIALDQELFCLIDQVVCQVANVRLLEERYAPLQIIWIMDEED